MREQYLPQPTSAKWTVGSPGNTGDLIRLAQKLGAQTALMDKAWGGPVMITTEGQTLFVLAERSLPFGIIVDSNGERFMNESASYIDCWRAQYERHRKVSAIPSQLAEKIGIDVRGLDTTIKRFNEMALKGKDEDFRRGESAYDRYYNDPRVKPNTNLGPINRPPYYATAIYPGDLGTLGGLLTDEYGRVLNKDGQPIKGLYAAGNASASIFGGTYPGPGSTLGPACTFAYITMKHLVKELKSA